MAFVASWLPYFAAGASALGNKQNSDANAAAQAQQAQLAAQQATVARSQAQADEETQRRQSRQTLGEQAAAMAETNTGYGGSNALIARQSAVNAELDALNIRYQGVLKASGLNAQATGLMAQANSTRRSGNLLAGTQLLAGISSAYTRGATLKG